MPKWKLVPLLIGQVAIAATLATNRRFTSSQFFPEGLVLFVATAAVVLVVAWWRSRRDVLQLQLELEALNAVSKGTPP